MQSLYSQDAVALRLDAPPPMRKKMNKIIHHEAVDAGGAGSGGAGAGGSDAAGSATGDSDAHGADASGADAEGADAPQAPADAGQSAVAPLAPADAGQSAEGADAPQAPAVAPLAPAAPWGHDTRSDARSAASWSNRAASGWNAARGGADTHGWSSDSSWGSRPSVQRDWQLIKRVDQLEAQVRQLHTQNMHLRSAGLMQASPRVDAGGAGSGGTGAGGSDGAGSATGDSDAHGDDAIGADGEGYVVPHWYAFRADGEGYVVNTPVPEENLQRARQCMRQRLHSVGPRFLIDNEGQGDSTTFWGWYSACRDRGMHQFGHRGDSVDARAASFTFWREGNKCFSARAVCNYCRCCIVSTASGGVFNTKNDEEMLKFFMLKTLANPASMIR
jgi:hypothetical protein